MNLLPKMQCSFRGIQILTVLFTVLVVLCSLFGCMSHAQTTVSSLELTSSDELVVGETLTITERLIFEKPVEFQRFSIFTNVEKIAEYSKQAGTFAYFDVPLAYRKLSTLSEMSIPAGESKKSQEIRFEESGVFLISTTYQWKGNSISSKELVVTVQE